MDHSRRRFLKTTGIAVAGVGGGSVGCAALAKALGSGGYKWSDEAISAKRWAMVVDTEKCAANPDCDECIRTCHREHNVPQVPDELRVKEEIKWIWKESYEHTFQDQISEYVDEEIRRKPVLVLCNHCDNPACVRVCPTGSTFKRSDGIVMMDMHRCIGCRYCIVACPYGARSFNFRDPRKYLPSPVPNPEFPTRRKGVVEKCTLCAERLAVGKGPACVEACPADALLFGDIEDRESEVSVIVRAGGTLRRKPIVGTRPQVYYKV